MKNGRFEARDYYFQRQDNTPWIPFEEEKKMDWKEIGLWIVALFFIMLWLGLGDIL